MYKIDITYVPAPFTILCQQTIKINYSICWHKIFSPWLYQLRSRVPAVTGGDDDRTKWPKKEYVFSSSATCIWKHKTLVKLNCWLLFFSHHLLFFSMTMTTLIVSQWYDKIFNDNIKHLTRTRKSLEVRLNEDSSVNFVMILSMTRGAELKERKRWEFCWQF